MAEYIAAGEAMTADELCRALAAVHGDQPVMVALPDNDYSEQAPGWSLDDWRQLQELASEKPAGAGESQ